MNRAKWTAHVFSKLNVNELKERLEKFGTNTKGLLKYKLVERLCQMEGGKVPSEAKIITLAEIPNTINEIKKLPLHNIKQILHERGICSLGNKDELVVMRLLFLKNGREQ